MRAILFICFLTVTVHLYGQVSFIDVTNQKGFEDYLPVGGYGSGFVTSDYNNDGFVDLFVLANEGFRSRLYFNRGDGTFAVSPIGPNNFDRNRAAIFLDFDGDHRLDLLIAGDCFPVTEPCEDSEHISLYKQMEDGGFRDVTENSGLIQRINWPGLLGGMAAGDFNNDGYLDLSITNWDEHYVFLNMRDGSYQVYNDASNIPVKNTSSSSYKYFQPVIYDFTNDGWADIYIATDVGENVFYENNGDGTFREIGKSTGLNNSFNDMGVSLGDFDNDEDLDIYITCIETPQVGYHNVLFENKSQPGNTLFQEVAKDRGVDSGGWGWGTSFMDGNNDGYLDLAATSDDLDQSKFWLNNGEGMFEDFSQESQFNDKLAASALASFDYDRDGDLDLVQGLKDANQNLTLGFRLLENQLNKTDEFGNYLVVKPRMLSNNHHGIGSLVKIKTNQGTQIRPITAGISFYSQEPAEAFFGLGSEEIVQEVSVIWPGGSMSTVREIAANQSITVDDSDVLHAPAAMKLTPVDEHSIKIEWGHMSTTETGFRLERSKYEDFSEKSIIDINEVTDQYIDQNLSGYTTYYYRLRARNNESFSNYSATAAEQTSYIVLATPTNFNALVESTTSVQLSWQNNHPETTASSIQRSLRADFETSLEIPVDEGRDSYLDSKVEPKTTYYYRVRSSTATGRSEWSETISVFTSPLNAVDPSLSFDVYPNPTNGQLNLSSNKAVNYEFMTVNGKVVENFNLPAGSAIVNLNFEKGVYILRVLHQDLLVATKKIIIR